MSGGTGADRGRGVTSDGTVRPRALVHRGVVAASALLFDEALVGEAECRRRVLAAWSPGATLHRAGARLILAWPSPQRVDCRQATGLPLVLEEGVLLAAPLEAAERDRLALPRGSVVLVRAGAAQVLAPAALAPVDPAAWLAASDWPLIPAEPLGAPPVARVAPATAPVSVDRASFQVGAPAVERDAVIASLTRAREEAGRRGASVASPVAPAKRPAGIARGLVGALLAVALVAGVLALLAGGGAGGLAALLRLAVIGVVVARIVGRTRAVSTRPGGPIRAAEGAAAPSRRPRAPARRGRLGQLAVRAFNRLLAASRLTSLLGRAHARYLADLFERFEQGDLDEALRRAIPLSAVPSREEEARLGLGPFGRRARLDIQPFAEAAGGSVVLAGDLFESVRAMYRRAFERLEAQGRFEEAAFVLAELLHEHQQAVSFLERRGKLRLAAELAEARGLPPALVIRQWVLAGDVERAVAIARTSGAFAEAVAQLERTSLPAAAALRLRFGEVLATAGDYVAAVEAVWPVEQARALAAAWIDRGLALGGSVEARLLPRKLTAAPDSFPAVRARAVAVLDELAPEGAASRLALARAVALEPRSPGQAQLARAAVRALLREPSPPADVARLREALVDRSGDAALRADLGGLAPAPAPAARPPLSLLVEARDAGALPIHDAALLPDGRLLVALGEAGCRLLRRDGTVQARLDAPAEHLVVSDSGARAIALAPRGRVFRLTRIDVEARVATPWCDAELGAWSTTFDGGAWFVGRARELLAVDALAPRLVATWRVADLPGQVVAVSRGQEQLSLLLVGGARGEAWQRWRYRLPSLTLDERAPVAAPPPVEPPAEGLQAARPPVVRAVLTPAGTVEAAEVWPGEGGVMRARLHRLLPPAPFEEADALGAASARLLLGEAGARVLALAEGKPAGGWIVLQTLAPAARGSDMIMIEGAARPRLRLAGEHLVYGDERGRLLVLHVGSGDLLRDLRL